MSLDLPRLREAIVSRVRARAGNVLRDLDVGLEPDGVTLRGSAPTFYVKQLAQHGVRELLPDVRLRNDIIVA